VAAVQLRLEEESYQLFVEDSAMRNLLLIAVLFAGLLLPTSQASARWGWGGSYYRPSYYARTYNYAYRPYTYNYGYRPYNYNFGYRPYSYYGYRPYTYNYGRSYYYPRVGAYYPGVRYW
jgi:hypothetical protein